MGVAIINIYLVILFLLVHFNIVRFNLFWKASPFLVILLTMFGLLIPMGWGAPQGSVLVVRNAVSIVPNVAGEVTDVPVMANAPLKAGEVLFKIDPTPYEAQVKAIEAQLKLSKTRLAQMTQLFERDSGRGFDVEQRQSEVDQLSGQLEGAQWNLDKTVVRAPADGYVTNLALRKGARVANLPLSPVMAFIDTSSTIIGVEINQNDARYIAPGQEAEVTFKFAPGQIYKGKVESVLQAIATGQTQTSGTAVAPKTIEVAPFVVRNAVSIVPNVAGEVTDVPVMANEPLKAGEVLFKIDPTPYEAQVKSIEAQLKLSKTRLAQMTQLFERDSGRGFDVEQRQSEVDQLSGQLEGAQWNLDKTTVRAPSDGYVTNLALRKGARVANLPLSPVMAFIDTSSTIIGVEINQINARYIAPGQEAEVTFKFAPGQIYKGKVESVLQAIATGQTQTSGTAVAPKAIEAAPFVVRVKLDDAAVARNLPAGSAGTAAIYTDHLKPTHVVRRVILRQIAIVNYVNPF